MKKLILTFFIMLCSISFAFASKPEYDAELSKIRTIKNVQTTALNKQIKSIEANILALELDETIPSTKKEQKLNLYTQKLEALTTKKYQIAEKYKKDKAELKKKYK